METSTYHESTLVRGGSSSPRFSIKKEVPRPEQWKIYGLIALLLYGWVVHVLNLIVAIIGAVGAPSDKRGEYLTTMGVSIVYLVLFVFFSPFFLFLPAYCAYGGANSGCRVFSIRMFLIMMIIQILGFILNAIGVPNLGACGFFNGSAFFNASGDNTSPSKQSIATGTMFLIVGILWLLGFIFAIILLVMICIHFFCGAGRVRLKRHSDLMDEEHITAGPHSQ